MLAHGYLCVHYGILFALSVLDVFHSKCFLEDYYHNLVVDDGSSRGGRKCM